MQSRLVASVVSFTFQKMLLTFSFVMMVSM